MFSFSYDLNNFKSFIRELGTALGVYPDGNKIHFPTQYADGYFQGLELHDGLEILLVNAKLNDDIFLQRVKSVREFYNIRMDEIQIEKEFVVKMDKDYIIEPAQTRAGLVLTSSIYDFVYFGKAGSNFRSISILLPKEWVARYLDIHTTGEIFTKYLSLRLASFNMVPFNAEFRNLFNEVFNEPQDNQFFTSVINTRIMMVIEKFFSVLHQKLDQLGDQPEIRISNNELHSLMQVESMLVRDFSIPAPTIAELSRIATMSATNLKKKFKIVYGNSVYEYYQKNRMQKARMLMLSGNYSIKEIGKQMGYQNLSNFAIAFKKEFNLLPSQLN